MRSNSSDELRHEKGESAGFPRTPPRANRKRKQDEVSLDSSAPTHYRDRLRLELNAKPAPRDTEADALLDTQRAESCAAVEELVEYISRPYRDTLGAKFRMLDVESGPKVVDWLARQHPALDKDLEPKFFPGTDNPILSPSACWWLHQDGRNTYCNLWGVARRDLTLHSLFNGSAHAIQCLVEEDLDNVSDEGWAALAGHCENCPAHDVEGCWPDCPIRRVLDFRSEYRKMAKIWTQTRPEAFRAHADGASVASNHPVRPVRGSFLNNESSRIVCPAQHMQSLCAAVENVAVWNRFIVDTHQRQINGDIINLLSAIIRGYDVACYLLHLKRNADPRRAGELEAYQVAAHYLWRHGHTDLCHGWEAYEEAAQSSVSAMDESA